MSGRPAPTDEPLSHHHSCDGPREVRRFPHPGWHRLLADRCAAGTLTDDGKRAVATSTSAAASTHLSRPQLAPMTARSHCRSPAAPECRVCMAHQSQQCLTGSTLIKSTSCMPRSQSASSRSKSGGLLRSAIRMQVTNRPRVAPFVGQHHTQSFGCNGRCRCLADISGRRFALARPVPHNLKTGLRPGSSCGRDGTGDWPVSESDALDRSGWLHLRG
jgi:hypothetical protein